MIVHEVWVGNIVTADTVHGRNPAPPEMYKAL